MSNRQAIITTIADRLEQVLQGLRQACELAGRPPQAVRLLAVSKTMPTAAVAEAARAGQLHFGENQVLEGVEKIRALADWRSRAGERLVWHCIGPIQSNKTRQVAEHFDWVHSIDRIKIAERLSAQRPPTLPPLQVLIQVNADGAPTKAGVAPDQVLGLAQAVLSLPHLQLRGLMAIPDPLDDPSAMLAVHRQVATCFDQLQEALGARAPAFDTLSLGMSGDLDLAVRAGSHLVRVGTAIFGAR